MQRFQDKQGLLILGFVRLGHALQHRVYEVGQDESEHTVPVVVQFHAYFSCRAARAVGLVWGLDLPRHVADERNAVFGRLTVANIHYLLGNATSRFYLGMAFYDSILHALRILM